MESAGNGTSMERVIKMMHARSAGITPPSLVPKKDEENLAPTVRTDVDHLAPQEGEEEDVPVDPEEGETVKDQVHDEVLLKDPGRDPDKDLEVHLVGVTVLLDHPNERGPEEVLGSFPVANPDLRRQGGAVTIPTPPQRHLLAVQEPHFPKEHLLRGKRESPIAETTKLGIATGEIRVISGMPKLVQYGQAKIRHADTVINVRTHIETPRMAQQPSKKGDARDNGRREGNLANRNPAHNLRCLLTSPPMEPQPLPTRKVPTMTRPKAMPGPEAGEFMGNALRL